MYVIADVEWISNNRVGNFPTQIAAMRIDSQWNEVNSFYSLIRPISFIEYNKDNIAFNGNSKNNFLSAKTAKKVLSDFLEWLGEDTLIWWYEESTVRFCEFVKKLTDEKYEKSQIVGQEHSKLVLQNTHYNSHNLYKLAHSLNISTENKIEHCSKDDVEVVRNIFKTIRFRQEYFESNDPNIRPINYKYRKHPYHYDPRTQLFHCADCEILNQNLPETMGFDNIVTALKRKYTCCSCCEHELKDYIRDRNKRIIEKMGWEYIFVPKGDVFHKKDCSLILEQPIIKGSKTVQKAMEKCSCSCMICKPLEENIIFSEEKMVSHAKPKNVLNAYCDIRAVKRQKVAMEERSQLLQKNLTQSEMNDVYTLTQPRFAFWAAKGYKNFHLHSCPTLRNISNLQGFASYNEAKSAGYAPCKHCKPTVKHDMKKSIPIYNEQREEENISVLFELCTKAGYEHHFDGGLFYIETPVGKWKISPQTTPVHIRHINLVKTPETKKYHVQNRIFLSLSDTFAYIKRHDETLMAQSKIAL